MNGKRYVAVHFTRNGQTNDDETRERCRSKRVESVGGRVQLLHPGAGRARFFSGFTGFALRWRFFSRRLLLLLRAGISSLRHDTTRAIPFSDLAPAS